MWRKLGISHLITRPLESNCITLTTFDACTDRLNQRKLNYHQGMVSSWPSVSWKSRSAMLEEVQLNLSGIWLPCFTQGKFWQGPVLVGTAQILDWTRTFLLLVSVSNLCTIICYIMQGRWYKPTSYRAWYPWCLNTPCMQGYSFYWNFLELNILALMWLL